MLKNFLSMLILLTVLLLPFAKARADSDGSNLPRAIIAYAYTIAEDIARTVLESEAKSISEEELFGFFHYRMKLLHRNIDELGCGIPTGLVFVHHVFISQANIPGHISGFPRGENSSFEQSTIPYESILFVTTPLTSFGNRVIVILSSVSPDQTTIFSVDSAYNVELLYDTFHMSELPTLIGSVYSVEVVSSDQFIFETRPGRISPEVKTFTLSITQGKFELQVREN